MQLNTIKDDTLTTQIIHTKQFKTSQIHIRFIGALNEKTITARSLMLAMIKAKNKAYPTRKALSKALESHYDMHYHTQALKLGKKHINQFTFGVVNPRFISDITYKDNILTMIKTCLHDVDFDEKTLKEEKQFLKDYFDAEYSNKSRYAYKRFKDHLFQGHPFNIHPLGLEEHIDLVTLDDIHQAYESMMRDDSVVISFTGDTEAFIDEHTLQQALSLKGQALPKEFFYKHTFTPMTPIKETMDITQDRLLMAYDTKTYYADKDYFIALVFNSLFGDHSDSLLFKTVREQHSLAYYIQATYSPFSGLITIMSGMEEKNIQKAIQMIDAVLQTIKENTFDEHVFAISKTAIKQAVKQSYDNPTSLSLKALRKALFNTPFEEDYVLNNIEQVSREDVVGFAKNLTQILIYHLGRVTDE